MASYLDAGFRLVFWPALGDAKGPREEGWTTNAYSMADYQEGYRVGMMTGTEIEPGKFGADVDLDWAPGSLIAQNLLPPTLFAFGRASKRVSHCVYTTDAPAVSVRFEDPIDKTCLIELRGTRSNGGIGLQSMIPPSIWSKDGKQEQLVFVLGKYGPPSHYPLEILRRQVTYSAVGMLLAKHLGLNGFGHEPRLMWAGFLLRAGIPADVLINMGEAMSVHCNNTEVQDVRRAVESTAAGLADTSKKIKGGPALAKHLGANGKKIIARINEWLGKREAREENAGTFPLTEAGDAECFADQYQDVVRYDHLQGRFLVADELSGIWVPDPTERLTQMVVRMMRVRQHDALALEGDKRIAAVKWSIGGENRKRVANALALARSVPPLADTGDNWDQEPFLLGVQNGVVDLRTGEFRKGLPLDRVTMRVRVPYDATATCPLWERTLADIFAPNDLFTIVESRSMVDFIQRAVGYSVTGDCREECCFFVWGDGCNGKGTFMNTLGWLLGDYTDDMPYSTLERSERGTGIPNDVAKLAGKRFITCSEVNEFNLNEARLKALTGRDPMTARFLNREFFTFIPVAKIWIATNNKPKIIGQDDGIWRRIHLIPFTRSFQGNENKQLKDQLRGELPGILNWIIVGAKTWLAEGLNPPQAVKKATDEYRQEANPIAPFIEACCRIGTGLLMQAKPAFLAYQEFHRSSGDRSRSLSDKAFGKAMRQVFQVDDSNTRQTFFKGVALRVTEQSNTPAQPEADPDDPGPAEFEGAP